MSGRKHSEESKTKISDAMVGNTNKKGQPKTEGSGIPSQAIEVTDITKYYRVRGRVIILLLNGCIFLMGLLYN